MLHGLVAQLGAHHIRIVGVEGSNPFKSTKRKATSSEVAFLLVWDRRRRDSNNLIRQFCPTMVLVEHDAAFRQAVSTDVIPISNRQEGCPSCHPKSRLPLYIRKTPEIKISGVLVETNGLEPSTSCV